MVLYTPAGAETLMRDLLPGSFWLFAQRGETLGERLFFAVAELERGHPKRHACGCFPIAPPSQQSERDERER